MRRTLSGSSGPSSPIDTSLQVDDYSSSDNGSDAFVSRRDTWSDFVWEALWNVWWKLQLFALGALHLLFSTDEKQRPRLAHPSAPSDVVKATGASSQRRRKTIVIVRHAESEWNVVFNRGINIGAIFRLMQAVIREALLLPTRDSIFLDSPLSERGLIQCRALADQLETEERQDAEDLPLRRKLLKELTCPSLDSVVACSNLRRTIDTARIVAAPRLDQGVGQQLHVLSSLQELGRNMDTLAISEAYGPAPVGNVGVRYRRPLGELFNLAESHGNKALFGHATDRMLRFATWCFGRKEDIVVVFGHSHWIRAFCREFLPENIDHELKSTKVRNCGVISFDLESASEDHGRGFRIVPETVQYLH